MFSSPKSSFTTDVKKNTMRGSPKASRKMQHEQKVDLLLSQMMSKTADPEKALPQLLSIVDKVHSKSPKKSSTFNSSIKAI